MSTYSKFYWSNWYWMVWKWIDKFTVLCIKKLYKLRIILLSHTCSQILTKTVGFWILTGRTDAVLSSISKILLLAIRNQFKTSRSSNKDFLITLAGLQALSFESNWLKKMWVAKFKYSLIWMTHFSSWRTNVKLINSIILNFCNWYQNI